MFTGIIEQKAEIISIDDGRFTIKNHFGNDITIGQSIAHDGACMTLENFDEGTYSFFVMQESLDKTNFGNKKPGDFFNVERCLQVGSRIDGHFVSGHIDGVATLTKKKQIHDRSVILSFDYSEKFHKYIIDKGSICINGVSLTIVGNLPGSFQVSLIPHTLDITNIGTLKIGDLVNVEFDMLGKYILNNYK